MSGREFVREIPVDFPESMAQHDVLAPLWARSRIDNLMGQDFAGVQQGAMKPELKETITNLGLEYRLMTQFTSFVAVEEMIVTEGGQPRRIDVPVEVPEGVNRQAVFGDAKPQTRLYAKLGGQQNFALLSTTSPTVGVRGRAKDRRRVRNERGAGGAGVGAGGGGGAGGGSGPAPVANKPVPTVNETVAVTDGIELSAEEKAKNALHAKLHPSLVALVDPLRARQIVLSADESRFVRDGMAELQVWLVDKTPETLAKLKSLGFEVVLNPTTSKLVIGRLPVEKLKNLAELNIVRYVAPQNVRS